MHSRIFQLETDIDDTIELPLTECDILGDWDEPGWFTTTIADYVSESRDREKDISWLLNYLDNCKNYIRVEIITDEAEQKTIYNSITFQEGFKKEYFKKSFDAFKEAANKMTLDEFCDWRPTYKLKSLIEDRFSFYVYSVNNGLYSIDDFIRSHMNEGTTYYFGNTLDYHF